VHSFYPLSANFQISMQHHAYLYEGSQDVLDSLVMNAKKSFDFEGDHNPDVRVEAFEKFGIEDAHALAQRAQFKSVSGRALFIIAMASTNTHAQQALLKLFEEPQRGITFVLLLPPGLLLPTLRSRLLAYPAKLEVGINAFAAEAKTFLKTPYKARSAQVAALLKDEEDTRERVRAFLNALEAELYAAFKKSHTVPLREGLEDIQKVRGYLADQSPSLKMLLEHLAVALPVM